MHNEELLDKDPMEPYAVRGLIVFDLLTGNIGSLVIGVNCFFF